MEVRKKEKGKRTNTMIGAKTSGREMTKEKERITEVKEKEKTKAKERKEKVRMTEKEKERMCTTQTRENSATFATSMATLPKSAGGR